jgi:sarcosine oxidase
MRVAVVGAGVNGLAAARSLARRGHEVVVHEQFELDHARGSSHGATRIFRFSYPDAKWVRLAQQSLREWRALEEQHGETIVEQTGILEVVRGAAEGSHRALEEVGAPVELLPADEVAERFDVVVPDGMMALYQADGGFIHADRARQALLRDAQAHGAQLLERSCVESLDDVDADAVVVTAGPWARALVAAAGIPLPVRETSETVAFYRFEPRKPLPSVVDFKRRGRGRATYALSDPVHGLKLGIHAAGNPAHPDADPGPDPELLGLMDEAVRAYFPSADPDPADVETCFYTSTEDEEFVLERHGRVVVGSACSGHGFKFAPVTGERLADLVERSD